MECTHTCPLSGIRRILLATDGSLYSEGAIREAIRFAAKCSSKLYVLTALEPNPEYETIGSGAYEREEAEAIEHLASVKTRAEQKAVQCETIFHSDIEPHEAIVIEATEKHADMIVIGRRGRRGLMKVLMGEVAAKVIADAPCKVLVVPRAARIDFRNILAATDGSAHSNAAVSEAIGIAHCSGSNLIALSAMRDTGESEEANAHVKRVAELGMQEGMAVEGLTPMGRSHESIVETAAGRGVDLIVMGAYGKTGVRKLLMGSSTEKVIGKAGCAVLVVKAPGQQKGGSA